MVSTAWIYSIQFEFWSPQLHQHLRLHSACHLNNKTYPLTPDLHYHQYLHLSILYSLESKIQNLHYRIMPVRNVIRMILSWTEQHTVLVQHRETLRMCLESGRERFSHYTVPCVNTLKQMSQTRTGFTMLYLMIGMSFSEHLAHRIRPQWRLYSKQHHQITY